MMRISLRSTFSIGGSGTDNGKVIELKEGSTISDLINLIFKDKKEALEQGMLIAIVNGKVRGYDHILRDGDTIDLHIPVSGG